MKSRSHFHWGGAIQQHKLRKHCVEKTLSMENVFENIAGQGSINASMFVFPYFSADNGKC